MHISPNKVVTVHYILSDDNHNIIENTYDIGSPTVYLHGRGQMVRVRITTKQSNRRTEIIL